MPQSLSAVFVHLVFSTKDRRPFLRDKGIREETHSYIGAVSGRLDCPSVIVGGVEDHVHILAQLSKVRSQADWAKEVKRVSSLWLGQRVPGFHWQSGYGIFSVGTSEIELVRRYIETQEEHHRRYSFQEELRTLLEEHGLAWDERYLWD